MICNASARRRIASAVSGFGRTRNWMVSAAGRPAPGREPPRLGFVFLGMRGNKKGWPEGQPFGRGLRCLGFFDARDVD